MLAKTYGGAVYGVSAAIIIVEVNMIQGSSFFLVGLPDNAIKESQFRIESTLKTSGFEMPQRRIIINMAPADLKKEGSAYDLALAIGILAATGQKEFRELDRYLLMGELALDGAIRPIRGALPIAIEAWKRGYKGFILPVENAREAAVVSKIEVYGVENFLQAVRFLSGEALIERTVVDTRLEFFNSTGENETDFKDVKGQENVKRALEIAAAGSHNLIMIGPPGSGKTMLAKRISGILPPLTLNEALETTKIHSVAGKTGRDDSLISKRPFRAPHHTISDVALVGGGSCPQPGEISLAHNGVLFLDELPEFRRSVLEVMRQPLEDRKITISRSKYTIEYPSSFMLVASMNPCPCGFYNHPEKECTCGPGIVRKYLSKISGPLLDRIDIHVEVVPVPFEKLDTTELAESSEKVRERVVKARRIQETRFGGYNTVHCNAHMNTALVREFCRLDQDCRGLLRNAMDRLGLSGRAHDRVLKVSRTIADLEGSAVIAANHLAEAIQYRSLDRDGWMG